MGSSKKHKEKKDKKKHKKHRSKDKDSHHKSHKSSHRKEKKKSLEQNSEDEYVFSKERKVKISDESTSFLDLTIQVKQERPEIPVLVKEPSPPPIEDEFDIDKLLDSKLSEKIEIPIVKKSKKRIREDVLEEFRKRQNLGRLGESSDTTRFGLGAQLPIVETVSKIPLTQLQETKVFTHPFGIPFLSDPSVVVKKEPEVEKRSSKPKPAEQQPPPAAKLPIATKSPPATRLPPAQRSPPVTRLPVAPRSPPLTKLQPATRSPPPTRLPFETRSLPVTRPLSELQSSPVSTPPTTRHPSGRRSPLATRHPPSPRSPEGQQDFKESLSIDETNKLRLKLGLKPLQIKKEEPEEKTDPQLSLSVNETNKLRAKLGLKPLDVGPPAGIPGITNEDAGAEISKPAEEVFVKTENIREVKKSEALREKLKVIKEKRKIEEKLRKTKTVAESDSEEESAADWVIKHQKLLKEKESADKRAKLLEEMDEEFGVGALVEEELQKSKNQAYSSQHLKGLTIGHDIGSFKEGTPVILTLKDKGVLEEDEDVLENVNIVDSEKYAKNIENKKKKPDYQPYEEPEYDEFGILKKKSMLSKYDEEIEGEKKKTFKIGSNVNSTSHSTREQELELIRMKLKQQNKVSLEMPEMKIVNEYYTPQDMVQFKKPKKKKKVRKLRTTLKAEDLAPDFLDVDEGERDFGSRRKKKVTLDDVPYSTDVHDADIPIKTEDFTDDIIDEEQTEKEFHNSLNKAKKLKERKIMSSAPEKVIEILNQTGASGSDSKQNAKAVNIEMNSVAEFCRTLGDIPTYGLSGNRDEEANDLEDLEKDLLDERQKMELDAQNRGAWNEVDIDEKPVEIMMRENEPILEEEPDINTGVAGALKLAMKKGYLDKESKKSGNTSKSSNLQAQSYTIEEKFYEDDKFGKRDRYTGPTQEFREKSNYKPDVKLEYIDDSGRLLTAKEAFRYLSHKFHGKGPGKNKVDKRMKKLDQDNKLKQMSSTDTPLNTVKLLQAKQKETQSPYIVLSGGNKTLTQTMISKTKL